MTSEVKWSKDPPTYKDWIDGKSHGMWWVKFILTPATEEKNDDGTTTKWREAWYTDIVCVTMSCDNFDYMSQEIKGEEPDYSGIRLHARGQILGSFDLDDEKATKDIYWQRVIPPVDDIKDKRPEVD